MRASELGAVAGIRRRKPIKPLYTLWAEQRGGRRGRRRVSIVRSNCRILNARMGCKQIKKRDATRCDSTKGWGAWQPILGDCSTNQLTREREKRSIDLSRNRSATTAAVSEAIIRILVQYIPPNNAIYVGESCACFECEQ